MAWPANRHDIIMLEIKKGRDNTYSFVVCSSHGQPLLESFAFNDSVEIQRTLQELRPRIRHPDIFERQTDHEGRFRFALKDVNGRILGLSKPYGSEAGMENGIANTRDGLLSDNLKG